MTKLYFHAVLSDLTNLPTTTKSAVVSDKNADAQTVNRTMNLDKGTAQTSIVLATLADTASDDYYFTKFVSDPLKGISSISANTWNYSVACAENNANANFPVAGATLTTPITVYVWRPSTQTKVGNILDGFSAAGVSEPAAINTETSEFATFTGASVASVQDGDVIVCEIWFRTTQGTAATRNDTFYFDGSVETNNTGTTVSSHAAYIETPQTLTFVAIKRLSESVTVAEAVIIRNTPGTAQTNISAKKGTITLDATGTVHDQAFTGIGFQPKAIIFFGVPTTAETYGEGYSQFFGFTDGTTSACVSGAAQDNINQGSVIALASHMMRNDACICLINPAGTPAEIVRGQLKTLDSDGFTITWNVKNTTQYILHYAAIGGSDITAKVASTTVGTTSIGDKAYTGVGFKPDAAIFLSAYDTTAANTLSDHAPLNIGAASGPNQEFGLTAMAIKGFATGSSNKSAASVFSATEVLHTVHYTANSTAVTRTRGSLTSFDSDGFTINHVIAPGLTSIPFAYLAIKGGYWSCGVFSQKSATGTQITSFPKQLDPELSLFVGNNNATLEGLIDSANQISNLTSIGAGDGSLNQGAISADIADTNTSTTIIGSMISLTSAIIRLLTPAATATSSTTNSEADINDMSTFGQFTLDWTTANATLRKIGYLVLGKAPGIAGGSAITRAVPTQTITVSESPIRLAAKIRSGATQTVTVSESVTKLSAKIRALATQTVAITDTNLVRVKGLPRAPATQTIAVAEASLTRRTTKNRAPATQTITVSETLTRLAAKIRALAVQTVTVSESLTKKSTKTRAPATENIVVSEAIARRATKSKALPTQTVVVSESLTRIKGVLRAAPTQTVTVTDAIIRLVAKIRAPTIQSITVSETLTKLATKIRALPTQTIVVSEAIARTVVHAGGNNIVRAVPTQTITVSDAIARRVNKIRALAVQTIVVSDVLNRLATKARALPTQAVTVSEVIARTVFHPGNNITRAVPTQTVVISDSITRQTTKIRAVPTQIITVTDSIIKITAKVRALPTQTVTVTDAITRTVSHGLNLVRTLTQNIIVGESLARRTTKNRALPAQSVAITDFVVKSVGKTRALATQTVTIGESLTKRLAKTRIIVQVVSVIEQEIKVFKNGLLLVPIQRPDKGGWFYKPPRIKQILYPVYIPTERERLRRRQKLREYPPLIIIPAFKYNINTVVAPFVITNPISQQVTVRFAIASATVVITYSGKTIPISLQPKQQQKRLNKARCASFIANQQALERYGRKLNRLSRVMTLWSMAQRLFDYTSHD